MNRWQLLLALVAAAALVFLASHDAHASDLYSNIGPGGSVSGLADRYPIGNYALDQHFSAIKASLTGGVDASGIPAMIAFFLANLLWQITAFVANALIVLFSFAFDLDLLNGSSATGGTGALEPVSEAISNLYAHTFGQPWMVLGVTLAGCWAMWRALIQRRYTETASTLAMSLVFCLIALAVVSRPDATIGSASRWTNQLSTAFLSVTSDGDITAGTQARRGAADELFDTLVFKPWVALNFGGTEHCIRPGTGSKDHDPISLPVRPLPAGAARQLSSDGHTTAPGKECVSNTIRYSPHFLRYAPGSDDRDAEYKAINTVDPSKLPDSDPAKKAGTYVPALIDKPAADAMEKGGQYQRLLLALVILLGELGAFLLLGALALSVVLCQIVVLLLACFAPVALVAGIIPGRGHDLFRTWASHLATYLVRKAAYSLVLAVVLAVLSALQDATSDLGWLMSFGLQAALLWMVFLQRHKLTGQLTAAVSGHRPERDAQLRRLLGVAYAARTITPARRPHTPIPTRTADTEVDETARGDDAPPAVADPPPTITSRRVERSGAPGGRSRPSCTRAQKDESRDASFEQHTARPDRPAGSRGTAAVADSVPAPREREAHRHAHRERADNDSTTAGPVAKRDSATVRPAAAPDARPVRRPDRDGGSRGGRAPEPPSRATPAGSPAAPVDTSGHEDPLVIHADTPSPPQPSDAPSDEVPLVEQLRADRQRLMPTDPDEPDAPPPPAARCPHPDVDRDDDAEARP